MNLDGWLHRIENLHPVKWDLGLQRVGEVARRLSVVKPAPLIFLVAGTNGKGSTCEYLDQMCRLKGKRVGKSTSPHLLRFNERIVIDTEPAPDEEICAAFESIDKARGDISLSYFEFSTLAALLVFRDRQVDVAVLEVGLGGRLDAMNLVEPDVSVITQIALDHQSWLGNTLDEIAFEKAGVMRSGKPCVVAESTPPDAIRRHASDSGVVLYIGGEHFALTAEVAFCTGLSGENHLLANPGTGYLPRDSAASAMQAMICAGFALDETELQQVMRCARLPGRMQWLSGPRRTLVDVAHNPNAAGYLRSTVCSLPHKAGIHAVAGMYADKDCEQVFSILSDCVDHWHLTNMDDPRAATARELQSRLSAQTGSLVNTYDKITRAYEGALNTAQEDDLILVFGSFPVVAGVLTLLNHTLEEQAWTQG